jgi:hypothetical protein
MKLHDFSRYDPVLEQAIAGAVSRIETTLTTQIPLSRLYVLNWLRFLSGSDDLADYYRNVPISPMFWFPRFLEQSLNRDSSPLQPDLVYSTINGYYYIRLIDNLMDRHATTELDILPALGFFHTQFQTPYQRYFPYHHPFWDFFKTVWFHSADVTIMDAKSLDHDQQQFFEIASKKICAIKIPLAAVAHHYGHPELIEPWSQFVDSFGRWHQMHSDVFHWHEDLAQEVETSFLWSAHQHKSADESITDWILREGFQWGLNILDNWMNETQELARNLKSSDLMQYIMHRRRMTQRAGQKVTKALQSAKKISSLFS